MRSCFLSTCFNMDFKCNFFLRRTCRNGTAALMWALSQRVQAAGENGYFYSVWKWLLFFFLIVHLSDQSRMGTSNTSSPRCLGLERQILHCGLLQPRLHVCSEVQGGDIFCSEFSEQSVTGRQQWDVFCYVHKAFLPVLQEQHINETVNTQLLFFPALNCYQRLNWLSELGLCSLPGSFWRGLSLWYSSTATSTEQ